MTIVAGRAATTSTSRSYIAANSAIPPRRSWSAAERFELPDEVQAAEELRHHDVATLPQLDAGHHQGEAAGK